MLQLSFKENLWANYFSFIRIIIRCNIILWNLRREKLIIRSILKVIGGSEGREREKGSQA